MKKHIFISIAFLALTFAVLGCTIQQPNGAPLVNPQTPFDFFNKVCGLDVYTYQATEVKDQSGKVLYETDVLARSNKPGIWKIRFTNLIIKDGLPVGTCAYVTRP